MFKFNICDNLRYLSILSKLRDYIHLKIRKFFFFIYITFSFDNVRDLKTFFYIGKFFLLSDEDKNKNSSEA